LLNVEEVHSPVDLRLAVAELVVRTLALIRQLDRARHRLAIRAKVLDLPPLPTRRSGMN
jgi:hypothetical protein